MCVHVLIHRYTCIPSTGEEHGGLCKRIAYRKCLRRVVTGLQTCRFLYAFACERICEHTRVQRKHTHLNTLQYAYSLAKKTEILTQSPFLVYQSDCKNLSCTDLQQLLFKSTQHRLKHRSKQESPHRQIERERALARSPRERGNPRQRGAARERGIECERKKT